jgi:transcription antitermination factor NusG
LSTSGIGSFVQELAWKSEEVVDRWWYAAYTTSCHEKQVAEHLMVRKIENFLPLYTSIRRRANGRTVTLESPLFPSYVFVQITRQERVKVLNVPGVLSLVGTRREPTPLPSAEMETLRSRLHLCQALPHPFLAIGEKVRVRSGPFAEMQGIVLRNSKKTRLVISLDLIMQSVAVEVDAADLEPISFASRMHA